MIRASEGCRKFYLKKKIYDTEKEMKTKISKGGILGEKKEENFTNG